MRQNAGTVLLYNCSGSDFTRMHNIFSMLRLRMRPVTPDRYHVPLIQLAMGEGESGEPEEPFPEPMLVFCGLPDALLSQVLKVLRFSDLPPIPLKAILTETNQTWDSVKLHADLEEHRAAFEEEERKAQEKRKAEKAEKAKQQPKHRKKKK